MDEAKRGPSVVVVSVQRGSATSTTVTTSDSAHLVLPFRWAIAPSISLFAAYRVVRCYVADRLPYGRRANKHSKSCSRFEWGGDLKIRRA